MLPFVSFQGRRLLQASLSSLIQKDETYREKEAWVVAPVAVCFELLLIHSNFHLGTQIILQGKLQAHCADDSQKWIATHKEKFLARVFLQAIFTKYRGKMTKYLLCTKGRDYEKKAQNIYGGPGCLAVLSAVSK